MKAARTTTAEQIEMAVTGLVGFCVLAPLGVGQGLIGWIGDSWWARAGYAAGIFAAALVCLGLAVYGVTQLWRRGRGVNNR